MFISLVPKVLLYRFLIRWVNNFRDFYWILIVWFIEMSVQTFRPLILFHKRINFVLMYNVAQQHAWIIEWPRFCTISCLRLTGNVLKFTNMEMFLLTSHVKWLRESGLTSLCCLSQRFDRRDKTMEHKIMYIQILSLL